MRRRVFIHHSPLRPVGGSFLTVKGPTARLKDGVTFEMLGKTYYVGKGGELRRLYK